MLPDPVTAYPQWSHQMRPSQRSEPFQVTVPAPGILTPQEGQGVTVYAIIAATYPSLVTEVFHPHCLA